MAPQHSLVPQDLCGRHFPQRATALVAIAATSAVLERAVARRVLRRVVVHLNMAVTLGLLAGLAHRLLVLLGLLGRLLLLAALLGELGVGALQRAARVHDGQQQQAHHHGEGVERVAVLLVEGDRVGQLNATAKLGDAEEDPDLGGLLVVVRGASGWMLGDVPR